MNFGNPFNLSFEPFKPSLIIINDEIFRVSKNSFIRDKLSNHVNSTYRCRPAAILESRKLRKFVRIAWPNRQSQWMVLRVWINISQSLLAANNELPPGERNVDLKKKGMFPVIVSFPRWIEREDLVYYYFFTYLRVPTGRRDSRRVSRIITMKFNLNFSLLQLQGGSLYHRSTLLV